MLIQNTNESKYLTKTGISIFKVLFCLNERDSICLTTKDNSWSVMFNCYNKFYHSEGCIEYSFNFTLSIIGIIDMSDNLDFDIPSITNLLCKGNVTVCTTSKYTSKFIKDCTIDYKINDHELNIKFEDIESKFLEQEYLITNSY